ncbi:hypothetical protein K461DRAFT_297176 [Myriangium duriaei CBS 260.36]|uniref:Ribosome biogenesis protein SLX9 n=1 Tax=Myriangium duriaei CBS 260.36 TaxID=1168546 RepID=A0A9P4MD88_9PEZI|nr:hypothetical protein K461DRAFT_297176 [Myriangium duriaei CBS 260.36]
MVHSPFPAPLRTLTNVPHQAPIKKRSIRARTRTRTASSSSSVQPTSSSTPPTHPSDSASLFPTSKKDKRTQKHAALLSRISKSAPGVRTKRRSRPNKRLAADLGGLLDTLPSVSPGEDDEEEWEGISDSDATTGQRPAGTRRRKRAPDGKIVLRTMKSRPGAGKVRAKLEREEKERFGRNMAMMVGKGPEEGGKQEQEQGQQTQTQADRWAALRGFIGTTMTQSTLFGK